MAERKWFKGTAALAIDDWFKSGDVATNLTEAQGYLQSGLSFDLIVERLAESGHGKDEFVHPLGNSRLQGDEFEAVTRRGYLEAIALALAHANAVPIKTFWMTGAGNDTFEMHITDEAEHVSVTLFVPDVDGGTEYPGSPESWVVRFEAPEEPTQTSGPLNPVPPSQRAATTA
jgi:hypothetical protein